MLFQLVQPKIPDDLIEMGGLKFTHFKHKRIKPKIVRAHYCLMII